MDEERKVMSIALVVFGRHLLPEKSIIRISKKAYPPAQISPNSMQMESPSSQIDIFDLLEALREWYPVVRIDF
jgi:hypothetical protein